MATGGCVAQPRPSRFRCHRSQGSSVANITNNVMRNNPSVPMVNPSSFRAGHAPPEVGLISGHAHRRCSNGGRHMMDHMPRVLDVVKGAYLDLLDVYRHLN